MILALMADPPEQAADHPMMPGHPQGSMPAGAIPGLDCTPRRLRPSRVAAPLEGLRP